MRARSSHFGPFLASSNHFRTDPLWIPFNSWQQLLEAERCDVLMDEVTGVASSRESMSMPAAVANTLVQLRRRDVAVRWSAPSWARADKIIRECSQAVTYARGYMPVSVADEDGSRQWRNRRLFKWSTYDAADFEEFTVGKRETMHPRTVDWHWGPKSPAFAAYDTFDSVLSIGTVSDSGRCYTCGGARRAHDCFCPDYVHRKVDAAAAAKAAVGAAKPGDGPVTLTLGGRPATSAGRTVAAAGRHAGDSPDTPSGVLASRDAS